MVLELTVDNFQQEVINASVPVLVDFFSPTCAPCRRIAPLINELAAEARGRYQVGKVNAWEEMSLAAHYRVSVLPTLLVFKDGEVVDSLVGYQDKHRLLEALSVAVA